MRTSSFICGMFSKLDMKTRKVFFLLVVLVAGSFWLGVALNYFGVIFESIKLEVRVKVEGKNATGRGSAWVEGLGGYVVPNVVHYIWFATNGDRKLSFMNYVSIKSANKIQKPEAIFLHCNFLPAGTWWDRVSREVTITVVHRTPPEAIHGQPIGHMFHRGDVAKIEILLEHGGIYLDYDVILVNSLDPVRKYDVTLGKEKPPKLIAGVMVARREALFLRLLHESYRDNYRSYDWDYNCARVAYRLALSRPDLINVEPFRFTTPDWNDRHLLWSGFVNWRSLYLIHVMGHWDQMDYTPESLRRMNNTLGEVMRFALYGDPALPGSST